MTWQAGSLALIARLEHRQLGERDPRVGAADHREPEALCESFHERQHASLVVDHQQRHFGIHEHSKCTNCRAD